MRRQDTTEKEKRKKDGEGGEKTERREKEEVSVKKTMTIKGRNDGEKISADQKY